MAIPVRYPFPGVSRPGPRACCSIALIAIVLSGCSINLGSLTPNSEHEEPARPTSSINAASSSTIASLTETIKTNPNDPKAYNMRGSVLAQAGKTEEALADVNKAIGLDPNYAQAYANRGLIYRQTKRLDQAMADYERALALDANEAPAYLGRGLVDKAKEAAADLDEAVQADPQNAQAWITRGLAYERLGDRTKAVGSYGRAINLRPKDDAARTGFSRVGGKPGQSYDTF